MAVPIGRRPRPPGQPLPGLDGKQGRNRKQPVRRLEKESGQPAVIPVVRALLNPNFSAALEALRAAAAFRQFSGSCDA